MSRIGNNPINIPAGVTVSVSEDNTVTATGPKGTLVKSVNPRLEIKVENGQILVINNNPPKDKQMRAFHGLFRQIVNNMVVGVSSGFEKKLVINGVGYKLNFKSNKEVIMNIGYSHPVAVNAWEGIELEVADNTLTIRGIDKELVGQFANSIRSIKPVEPYHAYGIAYSDEVVRRKDTKTGKK